MDKPELVCSVISEVILKGNLRIILRDEYVSLLLSREAHLADGNAAITARRVSKSLTLCLCKLNSYFQMTVSY